MDLLNQFPEQSGFTVSHHDSVMLLGSCFSTHMQEEFRKSGFRTDSNPFGVVFHPVPLARFICESLAETTVERVLQYDDVFLSWDAGSSVYGMSEESLTADLSRLRSQFKAQIKVAKLLIITVGSAHGYRLNSSGEIVANCHKLPGKQFQKELTSLEIISLAWKAAIEQLKVVNPALNIVFTVSPVRYSRDGWIENNRSKARLFELVTHLQEKYQVGYFPSFEIVNDLLRDYRYFEKDGVHPNTLAIAEVWQVVKAWYFDAGTNKLADELLRLRQMENHRLLFPESESSRVFLENFHKKRESFLSLHPYIVW